MNRKQITDLIFSASGKADAFDIIETKLDDLAKRDISPRLNECGVLPEIFEHDSSEEKLWAKYSDIILAKVLSLLGLSAQVMRTRGDSADVFAKGKNYTLVGDAKTFRLSRTAKNQKDFKIKALDDWRRKNDYALLVAPLSQYPTNQSQIYQQAIERNVTLLSYVHLQLMLNFFDGSQDLTHLWESGKRLSKISPKSQRKNAMNYWKEIDEVVCGIFNDDGSKLKNLKAKDRITIKQLGLEGIKYWEGKIAEYKSLSKEEAIRRLIKSDKIEQKIEQIRRAIEKDCPL